MTKPHTYDCPGGHLTTQYPSAPTPCEVCGADWRTIPGLAHDHERNAHDEITTASEAATIIRDIAADIFQTRGDIDDGALVRWAQAYTWWHHAVASLPGVEDVSQAIAEARASYHAEQEADCGQCAAAMVNGVFCHEFGCPNR